MNIDYKDFSHQLDGHWIDILSQYGIEVPAMRGINSKNGECPLCGGHDRAHWRDVGGRICLYCRNCAADSMHPPETVIMEYTGLTFNELVGDLSNYINHVPIERQAIVSKRIQAPKFNLPCDDKRDANKCSELLSKCQELNIRGLAKWVLSKSHYVPIQTFSGDIVNAAKVALYDEDVEFVAGGVSYGAYSLILKDGESNNYLLVASYWDAVRLSNRFGLNVMIAWSDANMKYIKWNAPANMNIKPVIKGNDARAFCLKDEFDWLYYDSASLTIKNMKAGENHD